MNVVVTGLVLLGPAISLIIALLPIVRFRIGHAHETIEATVSLRLDRVRIAIAVVALGVLKVLAAHVAAENAACWLGSARAC